MSDRIQVYIGNAENVDPNIIAEVVAEACVVAFATAFFDIFNRGRWTENDQVVNKLGFMESCHRLLSRVYKRWLRVAGYKGPLDVGETMVQPHRLQSLPAAEAVAILAIADRDLE